MKILMVVFALLFFILIAGCAQGEGVKTSSPIQLQVDSLAAKLANKEIGKIEILQIPAYILTRTRITPQMLEKQYDYKLTIRDVRNGVHQQKLIKAAKSVVVQVVADMSDIRWGVIFYDRNDTRGWERSTLMKQEEKVQSEILLSYLKEAFSNG